MSWFLQTPAGTSPKLLRTIVDHCEGAQSGGAAFAFVSAQGVRLLAAEPSFQKLLETGSFTFVAGLDAITDIKAVEELRKLRNTYPNFIAKLFLHSIGGALFHPKTTWLKVQNGGVVITGSGNLTSGGLRSNWEALAVELLDDADMSDLEAVWDEWLHTHSQQLVELDDPRAIEKAIANGVVRAKIKKTLSAPKSINEDSDDELDNIEAAIEEIQLEAQLNPVLIAEVPKSGNRWQQVNFDLASYQEYFGVTPNTTRYVRFYEVHPDGTLGIPEDRQSVSVVSKNFRFEIGAAHGKPYPDDGHPILVFMQIDADTFYYVLLIPGEEGHHIIQNYLDETYERKSHKLRVKTVADKLRSVWPDAPFFK